MKKTLIALAALAASGAVFAQSSVTLFGVLDASYERVKSNAGTISGIGNSANSSSRLGFRGVEDLGGGMSASFWLEAQTIIQNGTSNASSANNQVGTTNAGGLVFARRSTVSLSGGFGEIRVGRDYTPTFWNYTIYDPFGTNSVGATMGGYTGAGFANTFVRASNSVGYFLPGNMGGFFGQAMYAFGNRASTETATGYAVVRSTQDNGRYVGFRVGYGQGPINTAVSYGRTTYASGTNTAALLGLAAIPIGNFTDFSWGGSYTFGSIKAMAQIFRQKADDAVALGNTVKSTGWGLGGDWGVGAGDVLFSYSRAKLSGIPTAPDARTTKWALGYVHNLSKRTAVYGYFSHVGNSGGAAQTAVSFSSGAIGAVAGAVNANGGSTGIDIGIRHSF
ncbi:MAG TPA: porin [Ramlibacter sp.]|nr:porin [Ramlibacter sp.]